MQKFRASIIEHHYVDRCFEQEFECTDQRLWERLREVAEYEFHGVSKEDFPAEAPSDPAIWFDLIKICPGPELNNLYEDWISDRKGGYEVSFRLENAAGDLLIEE